MISGPIWTRPCGRRSSDGVGLDHQPSHDGWAGALWKSAVNEAGIDLDPARLSHRKNMVRVFYEDVWDKGKLSLVPELFHPGFTFRGSLGPALVGHEQFNSYVTWLTAVLEGYTSDIISLVEEGDTIAGKLRFHGTHCGSLFGHAGTGRRVAWHGAPFFTFEGDRIRDLWVLGDVHSLLQQLSGAPDPLDFRPVASDP
jgi:predicted ester cyclase